MDEDTAFPIGKFERVFSDLFSDAADGFDERNLVFDVNSEFHGLTLLSIPSLFTI